VAQPRGGFCLIAVRHVLNTIRGDLHRYRDREQPESRYQVELERFLLRCVCIVRQPTFSVSADDCGRYNDFLATWSLDWMGVSEEHRPG
jgi:hypothetical protein